MDFFDSLPLRNTITEIARFSTEVLSAVTTIAEPSYLIAGIIIFAVLPQDHPRFGWWSNLYKRSFVIYAITKVVLFLTDIFR